MSAEGGKNKTVLYVVIGLISLVVIVGLGFLIKMMMARPAGGSGSGAGSGAGAGTGSGTQGGSYQPGKGWTIYQGVLGGLGAASDIFGDLSNTFGWGNKNNNTSSSTSNSTVAPDSDQWA